MFLLVVKDIDQGNQGLILRSDFLPLVPAFE